MPYVIQKPNATLTFYPFPNHAPDVKIFYHKLNEQEFKEIREKHGKLIFVQGSKTPEFVVTNEEGFKNVMLDKIIVGWEGFVTPEGEVVGKDKVELVYQALSDSPWIMQQLIKRAMGLSEEADIENSLVQKKVEEASKNF